MSALEDNREEFRAMIRELEELSSMEGTEVGELCSYLILCGRYPDYLLTDEFCDALFLEVKAQLENFKANYEIVEEQVTNTQTYRTLEWKG